MRHTLLVGLAAAARLVVNHTGNVYVVSQVPAGGGLAPLPVAPASAGGPDPGEHTVSLNVKNAELGVAIENLANQAGAQLVIKGGNLPERVTSRLAGLPFDEALDRLQYVKPDPTRNAMVVTG